MQTNCSYSIAQNATGGTPTSTEPFAFASSTCETVAFSTSTATNTIGIVNGMTYDGIIASVFLFLILCHLTYDTITYIKRQ